MELLGLAGTFGLGAVAAGAFAVLFNVPVRVLLVAAIGGGTGLVARAVVLWLVPSLAFGSFLGAMVIGMWAVYWSHHSDTPGHVISIPGIIPMIPGVYSFRTLMGIWHFIYLEPQEQSQKLAEIFNFGLQTFLILLGISLGIAIPNIIHRILYKKDSDIPEVRS